MTRSILTALAVSLAVPASAAPQCAPTEVVANYHRAERHQTRQSVGLDAAGNIVTLWVNTETGSWAITISGPDGVSCLGASGDHHTPLAEPAGEVM